MTSTEATVDSTKLDTSSSKGNESGTGKAKEEKDERHRGWIYVVCCLLCLVVVLLTLCYLGWAMLWCPTFKRDATTSQSTIGTTTTISESTEDDHVSTALTSPKDDDHKTSEVTDETTNEKSTTDEPQEKTTTERITPEPIVPPIEKNFSRFRNANLSCVVGLRMEKYHIPTADLLELCLIIVAPTKLDSKDRVVPSLRDDKGLRQKYAERFYWGHKKEMVDAWTTDKDIFVKTLVQVVLPTAGGYGLLGFHIITGVTSGYLKSFIQSLRGVPKSKVILVANIEEVERRALEDLQPSDYQGVGQIFAIRTTFGDCAQKGIWHEESFLTKAHRLKRLPLKVALGTTVGPVALADFNATGREECFGGPVDLGALEDCRHQERATSDRFECQGNWYGAETKESVAEFSEYIKVEGFGGCTLQDVEIFKNVANVIDRNFTAFTCR